MMRPFILPRTPNTLCCLLLSAFWSICSRHLVNHAIDIRRQRAAFSILERRHRANGGWLLRIGDRRICSARSHNACWFVLCRCNFVFGGRSSVLGRSFDWLRVQFFITAAFALPGRENRIRIARALIDSADRRNDLAAAARTGAAARGAPVDVDS